MRTIKRNPNGKSVRIREQSLIIATHDTTPQPRDSVKYWRNDVDLQLNDLYCGTKLIEIQYLLFAPTDFA
jgi:hypothetical protein